MALVHEVRSAARCVFRDLIWFSAWPRRHLVKYTGVADLQVGDDEACVGPFRAGLDTGDDPLDAAPAGGPVEELLEAARLAFLRRGLEARLASRPSMCRRNVVVGATPRI